MGLGAVGSASGSASYGAGRSCSGSKRLCVRNSSTGRESYAHRAAETPRHGATRNRRPHSRTHAFHWHRQPGGGEEGSRAPLKAAGRRPVRVNRERSVKRARFACPIGRRTQHPPRRTANRTPGRMLTIATESTEQVSQNSHSRAINRQPSAYLSPPPRRASRREHVQPPSRSRRYQVRWRPRSQRRFCPPSPAPAGSAANLSRRAVQALSLIHI